MKPTKTFVYKKGEPPKEVVPAVDCKGNRVWVQPLCVPGYPLLIDNIPRRSFCIGDVWFSHP